MVLVIVVFVLMVVDWSARKYELAVDCCRNGCSRCACRSLFVVVVVVVVDVGYHMGVLFVVDDGIAT